MLRTSLLSAAVIAGASSIASATIVISEVHPTGSSNASYVADWFELTNTDTAAVDITGWKVDDGSNAFGSALSLRGITSIPDNTRVIFLETDTDGVTDASVIASFKQAWFGSTPPSGLLVGTYGGSGIGLSSGGDAVNIFNAGGTGVTGVTFGSATAGITFDNTAGLTGAISTQSAVGTNGAFSSVANYSAGNPNPEVGSPGLPAIPEPATLGLLGLAGLALGRRRR